MSDTELQTQEPTQSPGASLADELYATPEPEPVQEPTPEPEKELSESEIEEISEAVNETPETEEVEVQTLEQLAEHLETDPDWLRDLKVTEKVNGKEVEVQLSEALATHRKVTAGDDYLADAKTKAKAMIQESAQEKEIVTASAATLNALLQEVEQSIEGDMKDEDWARLRREDPAEYSAKKEEIRERRARYDDMKSRAQAALSETSSRLTEQQLAVREANLPKEREVFMSLVPEWGDEEVASKESQQITEYLTEKGHSEKEIEMAAYNGKLLAYIRNSMLFERSKGKIDAGKKRVVKIPKVMKPGKPAEDKKPTSGGDDRVSILYGSN